MAITSIFSRNILTEFGDATDNSIITSRDAAGNILVNGGAVPITGGNPTVANTALIQVFGQAGNDTITLNEVNGALPAVNLELPGYRLSYRLSSSRLKGSPTV